eukprot:3856294-Prymnesium_polylepis.1
MRTGSTMPCRCLPRPVWLVQPISRSSRWPRFHSGRGSSSDACFRRRGAAPWSVWCGRYLGTAGARCHWARGAMGARARGAMGARCHGRAWARRAARTTCAGVARRGGCGRHAVGARVPAPRPSSRSSARCAGRCPRAGRPPPPPPPTAPAARARGRSRSAPRRSGVQARRARPRSPASCCCSRPRRPS